MSILNLDLKEDVQREVERLQRADRVPTSNNDARTEILKNFHARGEASGHTFEADEPEYKVGGRNQGPRPLEYFLAGFAFCQGAIYAENALRLGIDLEHLSIDVHGDVDPRGTLGIGDISPGFIDDEVSYVTHIESTENEQRIRQLVEEAEEYCPAHAALRQPVSFDREIRLDDDRLNDL